MSDINNEGRTTEMLSAYLATIVKNDPVDNYFPKTPVVDWIMQKSVKVKPCKQLQLPINSGESPNFQWFSGLDQFNSNVQNTALTVTYPMVNMGDLIVIPWEDIHEAGPDAEKVFDIVKHRYNVCRKTAVDKLETALLNATTISKAVESLYVTIDSTGSTGGLSQSTDSDWASIELDATSLNYTDVGFDKFNDAYDQIKEFGGDPDGIFTTRLIYQAYKKEQNPDVSYLVSNGNTPSVVNRGFSGVEFMGIPVLYSRKAQASQVLFISSDDLKLHVDSQANYKVLPQIELQTQMGYSAKMVSRMAMVCLRRRTQAKIVNLIGA